MTDVRSVGTPNASRVSTPSKALVAICAVGVALVTTLLVLNGPAVGLVAVAALLIVFCVIKSPDMAVFVVVFILYSNIAAVASRFHGVPQAVAALFILLLAVPFVRDAVVRRQGLVLTHALPLIVSLLVVQVLGALFSENIEVTRAAIMEFVAEGLLVYFLITNVVRTPRVLRLAVWALLLAGFVTTLVPIYQQLSGSFQHQYGGFGQLSETAFRTGEVTSSGEGRQFRIAATIGEQNRYAQNMLMLLPLGFLLCLGTRSKKWRLLALGLTGFAAVGFLLAFSRGGAVAFVLVTGVMVLMRVFAWRHALVCGLALMLAFVALPQYWARLTTLSDVSTIFSGTISTDENVDSALKGRVTEMVAAALVFADHPVVGVGPRMFKFYSQEYGNELGIRQLKEARKAHSLYLEIAAENGALGIVCFFGMVAVTLGGTLRARRRWLDMGDVEMANISLGLFFALMAYLASALFLHLSYIRFFYLVLALAGSAAWIARHTGLPRQGAEIEGHVAAD